MEHQVAYSTLSEDARHAWETLSGLPLTTHEQQSHAWDVLRAELSGLAHDPRPSLHVLAGEAQATTYDLYVSGSELAALRVMVAWLKANDRAGRMRDLPVYPDLGEAILGQLGDPPWHGVWHPSYLSSLNGGGTLLLQPRTHVRALMQMLNVALSQGTTICHGWPVADRARLLHLLGDVRCWLQALLAAHAQATA